MNVFFWGTVTDRIFVIILYSEYILFFDLIFPVLVAIPFEIVLHFSRYSKYLEVQFTNFILLLIVGLIGLIVIIPKLVF